MWLNHVGLATPLLLMIVGTKLWFIGALLARARADNLRRESGKAWVAQLAGVVAQQGRVDEAIPLAGILMVAWIVFWVMVTIRTIVKAVAKTQQTKWKLAKEEGAK